MNVLSKPKALVIGVGPERGLGGALCKRFASEGHHVFIAGRTLEKLEKVAAVINSNDGTATPVICDATDENSVFALFDTIGNSGEGELDLIVYNVGNSTPGSIENMEADYFENAWRMLCFGGFLVGREVSRRMGPAVRQQSYLPAPAHHCGAKQGMAPLIRARRLYALSPRHWQKNAALQDFTSVM